MTDATQLREALDRFDQNDDAGWDDVIETIADAARTIALPILEQDQEVVERIMVELECGRNMALAVLAALISTEGEEG